MGADVLCTPQDLYYYYFSALGRTPFLVRRTDQCDYRPTLIEPPITVDVIVHGAKSISFY